eukprot:Sspe_Gene.36192::Locus_17510_Transcript_1_1_Confidence_1.000_Length_1487::g.36192::m.36192
MSLPSVGVGVGIVGKAVGSLGLVLQKRAHMQNDALPEEDRRHYCGNPAWIAGFLTYFAGNLITIVALTLAPQSIIAALDALVLVFNSVFAPQLLGEKVKLQDWAGNFIIIFGVVLVVAFGPSGAGSYSGDELIILLKRTPFIVYASCCLGLVFALLVFLRVGRKTWGREAMGDERSTLGCVAALAAGTIPAVLSSFNLQLSKITGELVATTIDGDNQFKSYPVYMFLVLLIACNTWQVDRLQHALGNYSALLIVPVFQVALTIFAVVNGGIYFDEFSRWEHPSSVVVFVTGIVLSLLGVLFLSFRDSFIDRWAHHLKEAISLVDSSSEDEAGLPRRPSSLPSPKLHGSFSKPTRNRYRERTGYLNPSISSAALILAEMGAVAPPGMRRSHSHPQLPVSGGLYDDSKDHNDRKKVRVARRPEVV